MRRRQVIAGLSASLAGALAAPKLFAQAKTAGGTPVTNDVGSCVLTIRGDDGPFYFDSKLVRANVTENKPGVPLEMEIRVVTAGDCTPIKGARADLWQADAMGIYSGYDKQAGTTTVRDISTVGQKFLRGTQFTDGKGAAAFKTIYPSWYRGRTPHVHFKVFLDDRNVVTNQILFPENINDEVFKRRKPYRDNKDVRDVFNADDPYLKRDGSGVLCKITPHGEGYKAVVLVGVSKA